MKTFFETLYEGYGQEFRVDELFFENRTEHQHLVIFRNGIFGRVMALEGIIQTTERDEFIMAEHYGRLAGYACFGPIPATAASYDLYWIAVPPDFQGKGLGRRLLKEVEKRISSAGGKRSYVDTSQRVQYASTRAFYESSGYRLETVLEDFYGQGEHKAIYCKKLY